MKSLPLAFSQDLLLTAIHLEHLYTFELPAGTYRWCSGNHSIYYSGYWWVSKQIAFSNAGSTMTGQADKLSIDIQNVDKKFSNIVLAQDVRGRPITIYRVLLDKNYQVIGAPILFFIGFIDQMPIIDRQSAKVDVFNHFVKWQTKTPKRQHGPECSWLFGGIECAYNGNVIINPISDISVGFTKHGSSVSNYLNVDDYKNNLCYGGTAPSVVQGSDSNYYTCILSHTSAAVNKPITGASWQTYWRQTSDFTGSAWASGQSYVTGIQSLTNGTGHDPTKAFDGSLSTYFQAGSPGASWLQYAFASAMAITKYTIYPGTAGYRPTSWHFQGSNDGATWIDLDIVNGKIWDTNESFCSFDVSNTVAYTFYRLYFTVTDNASNSAIIYELQMSGDGTQFNDSDYNSFSGTSAGADVFGFPQIVLAPDVTQIAVTVHLRAKQVSAGARNVSGRIRVFGTDYDATGISPATSPTGYDFVWILNPMTGVAWKYNEASPPLDDLTMANTAGVASADTSYSTSTPDKAFDNNNATGWDTYGVALPHWLQFLFNSVKTALGYTLTGYSNPSYSPTAWTIQGSNNGSSWTTLDTRSGISWSASEKKWFKIASPGSYLYYRINITAGGVSGEVIIIEMEYFDGLFLHAAGYSTPADAGGHEVDVSQCYLKNYSYANWCDLTPGRCYALNNRINFGGFFYVPEMAQKEFYWGVVQKIFTGQYGT